MNRKSSDNSQASGELDWLINDRVYRFSPRFYKTS